MVAQSKVPGVSAIFHNFSSFLVAESTRHKEAFYAAAKAPPFLFLLPETKSKARTLSLAFVCSVAGLQLPPIPNRSTCTEPAPHMGGYQPSSQKTG